MDTTPHTKYPVDPIIAAVPPAAALFPPWAVNEAFGAESVNLPVKPDGTSGTGAEVAADAALVAAGGSGIALTTEATLGMALPSISLISGAPGLRFDCASAI